MKAKAAPSPPAPPVSVHIDVVSLEGLSLTAAQAGRFRAALEQELSRLAGHGIGAASLEPGAQPSVVASPLHLARDLRVSELGREVGRRVWAALGRAGSAPERLV